MCGHAAPAVTAAVAAQMDRGATLLLPTRDAAWVGAELARRFRVPYWGFTTSATDANRAAIRIARMVTGRDVVLVFNGCYHGSVEEAHVALAGGKMVMRSGVHPNAVDHARVSRVVEFNDLPALEAALAPRDVAVVLAEPCMTNYGMIEAQPGFMAALRELTTRTGTLLVIDETHTWSCSARPPEGACRWGSMDLAPPWPSGSGSWRPAKVPVPGRARARTWDLAGRWREAHCRWPRCAQSSPRCSPRRVSPA
jgi:glutamate-1-semialdehyde 2,1-aminomutase